MKLKIENIGFIGIIIIVILAFFYLILGLSGMLAVLAIMLFFMLPAYFILDNFNLEQDEKIVFSFFIGAGIFPSIAYWFGRFIPFKIGIFITFAILIATAFLIKKIKKQ